MSQNADLPSKDTSKVLLKANHVQKIFITRRIQKYLQLKNMNPGSIYRSLCATGEEVNRNGKI